METRIVIRARETASKIFQTVGAKIRQATRAAKNFASANPALGRFASAASNVVKNLIPFRRVIGAAGRGIVGFAKKVRGSIRELGAFRAAARGIGGALKGVLGVAIPAIGAAVAGGAALAANALGGMRQALEGTEESAGGAGEAAKENADDFGSAASATEEAAKKAEVAFGAFGAVGEGFIQSQGRITEQASASAQDAADNASVASDALKETGSELAANATAASRFGSALDRIGAQFTKLKNRALGAIAKALTPALEKLADFMESPAFQKFIDLLAEDLADAAVKVADWIINKLIPGISDLIQKINDAGGPVEFFRQKWISLKNTALMVVGIILGALLNFSNTLRNAFGSIGEFIVDSLAAAGEAIADFFTNLPEKFESFKDTIRDAFAGIGDVFEDIFADLVERFPFIQQLLDLLQGGAPGGGQTGAQTAALGGGFAPRGGGEGDKINIYVTVPPGTANPAAFGNSVGVNIVEALRRSGQRVPQT